MKRMLLIVIALALMLCGVSAYAESGSENSQGGFAFSMPDMPQFEMPEMPDMNELTSGWGEFTAPEGWGSFSFDDFDSPMNGSWGNLGGSDWGSSFEDMQKRIQEGMSAPGLDSSDWPPESFKNMENAFNNQKDDLANGSGSGIGNLEDQYKNMFGDTAPEGFTGMPSLDSAKGMLGGLTLDDYNSSVVASASAQLQLSTISGVISSWGEKASETASFDGLELPDLGGELDLNSNMYGTFQSMANGLEVSINTSSRYNGSLFTNAPKE